MLLATCCRNLVKSLFISHCWCVHIKIMVHRDTINNILFNIQICLSALRLYVREVTGSHWHQKAPKNQGLRSEIIHPELLEAHNYYSARICVYMYPVVVTGFYGLNDHVQLHLSVVSNTLSIKDNMSIQRCPYNLHNSWILQSLLGMLAR